MTITTTTPGDGAGQPVNDLDPILELYDSQGTLLVANNNGAADGRNALISDYPIAADGTYRLRVAPVIGAGDYTLQVDGAGGAVGEPLTVSSVSLVDGAALSAFPGTIDLAFSAGLRLDTVAAEDLTVNGNPAVSVTVVDGRTLRFDIGSLNSGDGPYAVEIAVDAVSSVSQVGNDAFALGFILDATGPTVLTSSLTPDLDVTAGDLSFVATFSEDLDDALLDVTDVMLIENFSGDVYVADTLSYDVDTRELTLSFPGLVEGSYTLTLSSAQGGFQDLVGNQLNGAPSFPLPSGQGDPASDDFEVSFYVDTAIQPVALPLNKVAPASSLVYQTSQETRFTWRATPIRLRLTCPRVKP